MFGLSEATTPVASSFVSDHRRSSSREKLMQTVLCYTVLRHWLELAFFFHRQHHPTQCPQPVRLSLTPLEIPPPLTAFSHHSSSLPTQPPARDGACSPVVCWRLPLRALLLSPASSSFFLLQADWLVEIAPHYFDLENFPECEAKHDLEAVYRRQDKSQQRPK